MRDQGLGSWPARRRRLSPDQVALRHGDTTRTYAELDDRRARWLARVDAFRANRARLASDPSLGPDERATATRELFERSFTEAERRRVEALDRIEARADLAD